MSFVAAPYEESRILLACYGGSVAVRSQRQLHGFGSWCEPGRLALTDGPDGAEAIAHGFKKEVAAVGRPFAAAFLSGKASPKNGMQIAAVRGHFPDRVPIGVLIEEGESQPSAIFGPARILRPASQSHQFFDAGPIALARINSVWPRKENSPSIGAKHGIVRDNVTYSTRRASDNGRQGQGQVRVPD